MPKYIVHIGVEGDVAPDSEEIVNVAMTTLGFGKRCVIENGDFFILPTWLYDGDREEDDKTLSILIRQTIRKALGEAVTVLVVCGEKLHFAYTGGAMESIRDLDPEQPTT